MTHRFQSWDSVALETMSDLISVKVVTGEKAVAAQAFLKKGAEALEDPSTRLSATQRGDNLPSTLNMSFQHEHPSKGAKQL
jgi:hypothetical protein